LSEARKYRLSLIMAHQYVAQLDEVVADAVFGNVGTIITFRVGGADAEVLSKEFTPTFTEEDIVNLSKYQIILKLMIDGVASHPFSALTLPPIGSRTDSLDKVIRVSRERYGRRREVVEEKIERWSSSDTDDDMDIDTTASKSSANKNNNKQKQPSSEITSTAKKKEQVSNVAKKSESTISLKDLLPEDKKKADQQVKKNNFAPSADTQNHSAPSSVQAGDTTDADSEPKKKRKRKKKRKKNKTPSFEESVEDKVFDNAVRDANSVQSTDKTSATFSQTQNNKNSKGSVGGSTLQELKEGEEVEL